MEVSTDMSFVLIDSSAHDLQRGVSFSRGRTEPLGGDGSATLFEIYVRRDTDVVALFGFSGSVSFQDAAGYRFRFVLDEHELEQACCHRAEIAPDLELFDYFRHLAEGLALLYGSARDATTKRECVVVVKEEAVAAFDVPMPTGLDLSTDGYLLCEYVDGAMRGRL